MKTKILFITLITTLVSCSEPEKKENEENEKTEAAIQEEDLIEIKNGVFTEYYAGKKAIKFQGRQDKDGFRDGTWLFYSEAGVELSMTNYEHGVKQGHSIVKYPTGAIHYMGEYKDDKPVGIWKTYDSAGKVASVKDYDQVQ
jgi:antitoxin component YwqK of YwqJK toxin-antitoxin module